ncbi:hypothetical protein V8C44DRAFT_323357, partial [Trichoderma aethiopicum]
MWIRLAAVALHQSRSSLVFCSLLPFIHVLMWTFLRQSINCRSLSLVLFWLIKTSPRFPSPTFFSLLLWVQLELYTFCRVHILKPDPTGADVDAGAGSSSSASTGSRPIAIPRSRQNSVASACTLPEALSARGERQGGYFPFHEDPKTRVRHTHPFYREMKSYEMDHSLEEVDTGADADVDMPKPRSQYHLSNSTRESDAYWFPSDDDEDSEPFRSASMGKYYPGVYERRQAQKRSGRPVDPIPSSSRTPATQSRTPRTPKYRPRPRTPVLAPRSTATTEPIPPLKLSAA